MQYLQISWPFCVETVAFSIKKGFDSILDISSWAQEHVHKSLPVNTVCHAIQSYG